jgi:hypothetical protein
MGSSRSSAPAHLVCVGVCRYLAFASWQRRWRARDEGQGCEAPAKPACAERTSLTRVSRSPKLAVKSEMANRTRPIDPVSRSRARLPDAARFRARSTSHPVAARDGCTNIPLAAGRGSGERNHSSNRHFRPWTTSVRPPGSARTDQVLEDLRICLGLVVRRPSSRLPQ